MAQSGDEWVGTARAPLRKSPTLYDVAALAKVSHQTVSRLVKGHTNIRPEIRERVEAAIRTLNYKPNMAARSLATSRSHRIGALAYEIMEVGPSKILQGAISGARDAGYLLDIVNLDPNDDQAIEQSISMINQSDLDGLMVFAPTDTVVDAIARIEFSVPLYVESEASEFPGPSAATLNEQGVDLVVDHLANHGHRRFFHIVGPRTWLAARGRERSYEAALVRRGAQSVGSIEGDWTAASGYAAALRMPLDQGVTALVVGNDQMALGAMAALIERGVRIPKDMSVVGFDDIPESRFFRPALTTVRLDFERQGRIAVDRILSLITGDSPNPRLKPVAPELFARESSASAPTSSVSR